LRAPPNCFVDVVMNDALLLLKPDFLDQCIHMENKG
jgi:hypothetical protein